MSVRLGLVVLACAGALFARAGIFGESEAEKEARIASHVADLMRAPNALIAQAQDATEAGDIEEAIRLFSQAQEAFVKIEEQEDTSGTAFATMRLKKFHCISMLDALALKRSEVMDVRQAVTDTSELEARLRAEREAIEEEQKAEEEQNALPTPPTLREQLAQEEKRLEEAKLVLTASNDELAEINQRLASGTLTEEQLATVTQERNLALEQVSVAQQQVGEIYTGVMVLRKEIAAEEMREAEARARAEIEAQQLEAERLMQQQAEAEAIAKALEKERSKEDAQALKNELQWCHELWNMKKIDALEQRLMNAMERWHAPEFMVLLARIRLVQGRYDDALEIAATIPATGETGLQARMVAAGAYLSKNQPFEAMTLLEATMKEFPKHPTPCFNMAITLLRLPEIDPDRELSAKYYTRSVELGGKRSLSLERRLNME